MEFFTNEFGNEIDDWNGLILNTLLEVLSRLVKEEKVGLGILGQIEAVSEPCFEALYAIQQLF